MKNALQNSRSLPAMLSVNVLTALYTAGILLPVPDGQGVRPMGWAMMIVIIAAVAFCVGAFLSISDMMAGKIKFAIVGALLSVTPFPLAMLTFKMLVLAKGLQVAD